MKKNIVAVLGCAACLTVFGVTVVHHSRNTFPDFIVYEKVPVVPPESSSQAPVLYDEHSSLVPENTVYVAAVCGAQWPSDWHVRSSKDQLIWNQEGNGPQPISLTASDFFSTNANGEPVFFARFKPAVFSVASAEQVLFGHQEDPGAEDSNRNELDILRIDSVEMQKLIDQLKSQPGYAWKMLQIGSVTVPVLRNMEEGKYYGQEIAFVTGQVLGSKTGLMFFNRSTYQPNDADTMKFRQGVERFLASLDLRECPRSWLD